MKPTPTDFSRVRLDGGSLPLNFINTVSNRVHEPMNEYLNSYEDWLNWSVYAGALTDETAVRLRREAAEHPQAARAAHRRALALRDHLHAIFSRVANGDVPDEADLDALNAALAEAVAYRAIAPEGRGFVWRWAAPLDALDQALWIVTCAAADLLTSPLVSRVRECPAPEGCGWLFLDTSKNRSRRWCSMETCGNQAKARRHYRRQKG